MASKDPLGVSVKEFGKKWYKTVSAGHPTHQYVPGLAMPLVFENILKELNSNQIIEKVQEISIKNTIDQEEKKY